RRWTSSNRRSCSVAEATVPSARHHTDGARSGFTVGEFEVMVPSGATLIVICSPRNLIPDTVAHSAFGPGSTYSPSVRAWRPKTAAMTRIAEAADHACGRQAAG